MTRYVLQVPASAIAVLILFFFESISIIYFKEKLLHLKKKKIDKLDAETKSENDSFKVIKDLHTANFKPLPS